jgi:protease-4
MSRRLAIWLLLVLLFVALVATAAVTGGGGAASNIAAPIESEGVSYTGTTLQSGDSGKHVAIVPITGVIVNGDSAPDGSATGGDDVVRMLDAIREDGGYDGVIMQVDTPGGAVLASSEIAEAVKRLEKNDIPVVAWMRDAAASGGYYISAPATRIVAAPTTFTGSIGVIMELYDASGLADKVGVDAQVIKSGDLKDMGSPFRALTPEERTILQSVIDEAYGDFVDEVSTGRDIPEDEVRKIADGRIYTGRQAKDLDLVDDLGLRSDAYDSMAEVLKVRKGGDELTIVEFGRTYGFFEALSASAAPSLKSLALARSLSSGDVGQVATSGARQFGNGFATVEYRAEIGS